MRSHYHLRQSRPLRILVLLFFAFALILQPVLAAAGEMHELAHDPSGLHSHTMHADDGLSPSAPESSEKPERDESGTLHILLDFAHCCGQTAGAFLPLAKAVDHLPPAVRPLLTQSQIVLPARLFAPFRPPIFA